MQQDTVGAGKDTLTGFENLTGSAKDDKLTGNAGNNIIEGGKGDDALDGGAGIDTLSFANAAGVIYFIPHRPGSGGHRRRQGRAFEFREHFGLWLRR